MSTLLDFNWTYFLTLLLGSQMKVYTYKELKKASNNFSLDNKINQGGFGTVYKVTQKQLWSIYIITTSYALVTIFFLPCFSIETLRIYILVYDQGVLKDGRLAAIKVLSLEFRLQAAEFLAEISVISEIQHENLVELYGCCVEGNHRILVYSYLENSSLAQTLLGKCIIIFFLINFFGRIWEQCTFYFTKIYFMKPLTLNPILQVKVSVISNLIGKHGIGYVSELHVDLNFYMSKNNQIMFTRIYEQAI